MEDLFSGDPPPGNFITSLILNMAMEIVSVPIKYVIFTDFPVCSVVVRLPEGSLLDVFIH